MANRDFVDGLMGSCISLPKLSNECLLTKFGIDTPENKPLRLEVLQFIFSFASLLKTRMKKVQPQHIDRIRSSSSGSHFTQRRPIHAIHKIITLSGDILKNSHRQLFHAPIERAWAISTGFSLAFCANGKGETGAYSPGPVSFLP